MRPVSFLNEEELHAQENEELDVLYKKSLWTQSEHSQKEGKKTRTKKSEAIVNAEADKKKVERAGEKVVVQNIKETICLVGGALPVPIIGMSIQTLFY